MKRSIEYIVCKNCGKTWGNHYAKNCFHYDTVFVPRGYELCDICSRCGKRLDEHINHLVCPRKIRPGQPTKFRKEVYKLDDNLFEI